MKLPPSRLVLVLGWCALLTGCLTAPRPSGVTVSLVGFRPVEPALVANHAIMSLRFTSENVSAVGFASSAHQLYLNGIYTGKAESSAPVGVPPLGTLSQDVTLVIENPAAVKQALAVSGQAPVSYRLESVFQVTEVDEKYRLKTSDEGSVTLQGLEAAAR